MSAVSTNVPPASTNAVSCCPASSSEVSLPQVIVPRAVRETQRPDLPTCRCSMRRRLPCSPFGGLTCTFRAHCRCVCCHGVFHSGTAVVGGHPVAEDLVCHHVHTRSRPEAARGGDRSEERRVGKARGDG